MNKAPKRLDPSHVVVESVAPVVDGGRFATKAVAGAAFTVSADVFSHGHEIARAHVRFRHVGTRLWTTLPMLPVGNDRFAADVVADEPGTLELEVVGEVDEIAGWRDGARRRVEAGTFDPYDPGRGAELLAEASHRLAFSPLRREAGRVGSLSVESAEAGDAAELGRVLASCDEIEETLRGVPPGRSAVASARYQVLVSRPIAAFSAWYECFPRSTSPSPARPGTLRDLAGRLDYIASMGFDVLYLPPIHPIGVTARKGRGNSTTAGPGDPGSPWAIGSEAGGHDAIAPELGTLEDFDALVEAAGARGIDLALDLALQCSPDHPWVLEHPDWFAHRPDGTIACAENPPKRYEDIYPIDFDTPDRDGLYAGLLGIVRHWISHGVRIFRVDNPHTKPFAFWEWLLASAREDDPGLVFLSEAFTRPKVMHRLAKLGFDQSYTYFTWRSTKRELTEYFEELAHGTGSAYLRPNVWPNTPDICATSLQHGGRPSFVGRLVLAAGLSANFGIYGPLFELLADRPARPGTDGDYADSEKYEVHHWDLDDPRSIAGVVARVNDARRSHPAFARDASLHFHHVDNTQLICWSKRDPATGDTVLCVVNLDTEWLQSGFVQLDLAPLGIVEGESFTLHDHLDGAIYTWRGARNFVLLDPARSAAHLFGLERSAVALPPGDLEDGGAASARAPRRPRGTAGGRAAGTRSARSAR
ncbi:MAG TPA: maltotransferase domain-containing protein [Acidimicrobiales bacterium]|nr:maltotransferase domain-containing protein [Acidimicrobiales bacterium]